MNRSPTEKEIAVATALMKDDGVASLSGGQMQWADMPSRHRDIYLRNARAAIRALRGPDADQLTRMIAYIADTIPDHSAALEATKACQGIYAAAIDAASPPEQPNG